MNLTFKLGNPANLILPKKNTIYLTASDWDDYSFRTTFRVTLFGDSGVKHDLGEVKIGYVQQASGRTVAAMAESFEALEENYFSLGQSVDYYSNICQLPKVLREAFLRALRDVVYDDDVLTMAKEEKVFEHSLLRSTNLSSISTQFKRILSGGATLTEFHFGYQTNFSKDSVAFSLAFDVVPNAKPSQNIHVLIGRNGIGKTTLLNGMINTLVSKQVLADAAGQFIDASDDSNPELISDKYFAGLISVSFSAFDSFVPPPESKIGDGDLKYSYIGLKTLTPTGSIHKNPDELSIDFVESLEGCFGLSTKRERWHQAIAFLESDQNFAEMDLSRLLEIEDQDILRTRAKNMFLNKMSSGHAIVLLSITKMIERAEEKTLVILDEPESHLHPPLLSAFMRALADLLNKINGVAIIATHSPVVLQEVPKSCVWKLYRSRLLGESLRPEMETYGENVGTLTREVFGLEVTRSGFYDLLTKSVNEDKSYEEILSDYGGQLGFEGRAILRALISSRDKAASVK